MDERVLLRISLVSSLVGIFFLFIIVSFFTVEETAISGIPSSEEGTTVHVKGFVESVQNRKGIAIIEIAELKSVSAVLFTSENVTLEKGQKVEVRGKVREYGGQMQLVIDELKRVRG